MMGSARIPNEDVDYGNCKIQFGLINKFQLHRFSFHPQLEKQAVKELYYRIDTPIKSTSLVDMVGGYDSALVGAFDHSMSMLCVYKNTNKCTVGVETGKETLSPGMWWRYIIISSGIIIDIRRQESLLSVAPGLLYLPEQ